ncbi:ABC transporter permease [Gluconacetobacter takamatsuzukensis]|uniref:FtsX-like permease family protein n=1 Tax=Gluconacetobacter takamatsuzukensis TaxID=1286190 RepID=A0A7W4KD24_9PROT|nr:ABC transporter permease [Gluconacetobacter takamatsuzukensis]MBB2204708.1 FtsX-like permease family protein [Gluconacetobacter takamatsuzukensis]
MLSTILRGAARQARRHPVYVGLDLLGLALGIGVFLSLALLVRHEYSFNAGLPGVERLVRLDERWTLPGVAPMEEGDATYHAIPFLLQDFPEIEDALHLVGTTFRTEQDGKFTKFDGIETDASFFRVFGIGLSRGVAGEALARPDGLVLSEKAALKAFGTLDVLGRRIELNRLGTRSVHVVTGIMTPVRGPNLLANAEMVVPIPAEEARTRPCFLYWGSSCDPVILRLRKPEDIDAVRARLRDFVIRHASGAESDPAAIGPHPEKIYELRLVPLRQTNFYDVGVENTDDGVDRNVVDAIGLIGFLALVLACANTINLATARAGLRAREVAVRKTLGATRRLLFVQFMGEALFVTSVAGIVGLVFCEILTPEIASLTGEAVTVSYGFVLAVLPVVIVLAGLASGFHPATILSGYRPAAVLAAARMPSGGRGAARLRNSLVAGQFAIAVAIVICTLVIDRQTAFMRDADRGYVKSGLLVGQPLRGNDPALERRMLDALRSVPGVTAIAFGILEPNPHSMSRSGYKYAGPNGPVEIQMLFDRVGPGYFEVYRPRLLAGRWFDPMRGQDEGPDADNLRNGTGSFNAVVNAKAAATLGFASPGLAIGQVLTNDGLKARIIGVVDDMRFVSPRDPVSPEIIYFDTLARVPFVDPVPAVRFAGVTRAVMAERLDRAWATVRPELASSFQPADERMEDYFTGDERRGHIFTLGAVVSLLIACMGLYSLAAFSAIRRVHEIGIRKTLGASGGQIAGLLLRDFLRPVALACVLACPVAWVLMRSWLSGFDQRVPLSPLHFLIAVGGAFLIATLTVLGQTIRVARAEPARALRAQ